MKEQHSEENLDFSSLNVVIRSFTNVNDLIFPLKIHIKDITHNLDIVIDYKVNFIENTNDQYIYSIDSTDSPFKEEIELYNIRKNIEYIFKFIDGDIVDKYGKTVLNYLGIDSKNNFIEFMLNSDFITYDDIIRIGYEINFLIGKIKGIFMERAMKILEWNREFPDIKLKKESKIPEQWKKLMMYPMEMVGLQTVSEYPMEIWFGENIGKAYNEWSWRERELKKLYITMKVRIENFKELVKAKEIESSMEEAKGSGGKRR